MSPIRLGMVAALACALGACADTSPTEINGCKILYQTGNWQGDPYEYFPVVDFRDNRCPVNIVIPDEIISAGGDVYHRDPYDQYGSYIDTEQARLKILNAQGIEQADDIFPFLYWNVDESKAEMLVDFPAASAYSTFTESDRLELRISDFCCTLPQFRAEIELQLNYQRDGSARVAAYGTRLPLRNTVQTWQASSPSAGRPHQYRWYRDGTWVGTGATYAGDVGASDFDLRVDMTDTYGRTATSTERIDVDGVTTEIEGPDVISADGTTHTWQAAVRGGYPPYSYQWSRYGSPVGTGSTYSARARFGGEFVLGLSVTDAAGTTAITERTVHVAGGGACGGYEC